MFVPKYLGIGLVYIFADKNKKHRIKKNFVKPKSPKLFFVLSISIYLISVFTFVRWYVQGMKIKNLTEDILSSTEIIEKIEAEDNTPPNNNNNGNNDNNNNSNNNNNTGENNNSTNNNVHYPNDYWDYINVPYIDVNFDSLLKKNKDTVGWIKLEGTKVNYPVVQTTNNEYYLHHDFQKNSNNAGWIFADYRTNFVDFRRNTIIYGHNMNNKTMFGSIPSTVLNSSWQNNKDNHYIKISTPTANTIWKIFSIYTIEPETYYLTTTFSDESFNKFINTIKNRSIYNFNTEVTIDDKIMTLSTCDNTGKKRVVIHGKLIKYDYK